MRNLIFHSFAICDDETWNEKRKRIDQPEQREKMERIFADETNEIHYNLSIKQCSTKMRETKIVKEEKNIENHLSWCYYVEACMIWPNKKNWMKETSERREKKTFLDNKSNERNPMSISSDDYEHGMHFGCSRQPVQDHINFTLGLGSLFLGIFQFSWTRTPPPTIAAAAKKWISAVLWIARVNRIMAGWMVYIICLILHMAKRATIHPLSERIKLEYSRTKLTICCYFIRTMNDERIPDEKKKEKKPIQSSPFAETIFTRKMKWMHEWKFSVKFTEFK